MMMIFFSMMLFWLIVQQQRKNEKIFFDHFFDDYSFYRSVFFLVRMRMIMFNVSHHIFQICVTNSRKKNDFSVHLNDHCNCARCTVSLFVSLFVLFVWKDKIQFQLQFKWWWFWSFKLKRISKHFSKLY